jgi:hypothetical protein
MPLRSNDFSIYFYTIFGAGCFFEDPLNNWVKVLKQKMPKPLAL